MKFPCSGPRDIGLRFPLPGNILITAKLRRKQILFLIKYKMKHFRETVFSWFPEMHMLLESQLSHMGNRPV